MSAYNSIDLAKAGLIDGLNKNIHTLAVQTGDTFDFGDPVFVEQGTPEVAELGDNTNSALVFAGVAIISQRTMAMESQGDYGEYSAMNVISAGRVWVKVPDSEVALGLSFKYAYVIDLPSDADYGKFSTIDTWYGPVGRFMSEPVLVGSDYLAIMGVGGFVEGALSET